MMKQITIRQLGPELERHLRELARQEGISLNRAALKLMRKGAGVENDKISANVIGPALDEHMGTWSEKEERELLEAIASCEAIDSSMWE